MKHLAPFVIFVLVAWGPALATVLLVAYGLGHPIFVPNDGQMSALVAAWCFSFVGAAVLSGMTAEPDEDDSDNDNGPDQ